MMFEEMFFHPESRNNPDAQAAAWLMAISALRDDAPRLYEPGLEIYRALRSGDSEQIAAARESFKRVLKVMNRGPWFHEMFMPDDEESFMMFRHLPEVLEHAMSRLEAPAPRRKSRVKEIESE